MEQSTDKVLVADVEVQTVLPSRTTFALEGRGADGADYRLEMHLEMPVDARTAKVLGELFAQSEWRIWRRHHAPLRARAARPLRRPKTLSDNELTGST